MAKKFNKNRIPITNSKTSIYPSKFGSHSSMVNESETEKLTDPNKVVCEDEHGYYITDRIKLDDRLADMNRALITQKRNEKLSEYGIVNVKTTED